MIPAPPDPTPPAGVATRLVPERVLRRVVKAHRRIRGFGLRVPHADAYALPARELPPIAGVPPLEADALVVLLADHPDDAGPHALLARWRRAFEAAALLLIEDAVGDDAAAAHLDALGPVERDEALAALASERRLLPPRDGHSRARARFAALAAAWLTLRHLGGPGALDAWFPALSERGDADRLLTPSGLDVPTLLAATRPPGAPRPEELPPPPEPVPLPAPAARLLDPRARARAARSARRGNHAGAALRLIRGGHDGDARAALAPLAAGLAALPERASHDDAAPTWLAALTPLLGPARLGLRAESARLLHDLQRAVRDATREAFRLDWLGFLTSLGRRPLREPLPTWRALRVAHHLDRARGRLARARVARADRAALHLLLDAAHAAAGASARVPVERAAQAALLTLPPPAVPLAEGVAEERAAAELADRAARGRLAFPDLRDALARNARKLPDPGLHALGGEPLLRADRALARALPGVHRPAEVYRRGLHRLSALLFGNPVGRALVLWLILPFGGAAFLLEGLQHTVGLGLELLGHEVHLVSVAATLALGVVIGVLIHSPGARGVALAAVRALGRALRVLFLDLPRAVWGSAPMRRLRATAAWPWLLRGLVVPALLTAALAWPLLLVAPSASPPDLRALAAAALFAAISALSLSALGPAIAERAELALHHAGRFLVERFWLGLVRLVLDVFAAAVRAVERALYAVDEALRYREGDPRRGLVVKGLLALPWGVVAYVARFYLNVLIEPKYNPIKHFPTVTVGHKLLLPVALPLTRAFAGPLGAVLGEGLGTAVAAVTVFLLPGLAGFLVWELKETWRIYAANRPATLRPAVIGSHGETMRRLLVPGFHAGTLPRAYRKLRRGLRDVHAGAGPRQALAARRATSARAAIHHVEEAIARFVDRELCALVRAAGAADLRVVRVEAGASRVRVGLRAGAAAWTWRLERVGALVVADRGEPPSELGPLAADAVEGAFLGLCALSGAAPVEASGAPAAAPVIPWSAWVARWEGARARATNGPDAL